VAAAELGELRGADPGLRNHRGEVAKPTGIAAQAVDEIFDQVTLGFAVGVGHCVNIASAAPIRYGSSAGDV